MRICCLVIGVVVLLHPACIIFSCLAASLDGYEPSALLARALAWRSAKGGELSDVRENVEMCEIGQSGRSLSSVN